ncbi:MAG: glycosyltransferase family 4 protein [Betaproteobacteria bacterium]|nr:glycosyltransferase family 4 protein [Betaproteobacteria bacterium]
MMTSTAVLLPPATALVLSFGVLLFLLRPGTVRYLAMDHPNQRSLHSQPVPRGGGVAIILALFGAWGLLLQPPLTLMLLAGVLAGISYTDDWKGLPVAARLAVHGLAAVALVRSELPEQNLDFWLIIGLAGYVIWMTNAYNFMDGADGLAGGMAVFGFSAYGLAACAAAESFATMCFVVAAAAAGFLPFNFPPAKIFMGDVGSIPLGFLAAALGFMGWQQQVWPLWFPLLVFSPFLVDASVTLLRRVMRGERFWQAHREHYYQRLIRMGWNHRRTALSEYLLMAAASASAVHGLRSSTEIQISILVIWFGIFAGTMLAIDHAWKRFIPPAVEHP